MKPRGQTVFNLISNTNNSIMSPVTFHQHKPHKNNIYSKKHNHEQLRKSSKRINTKLNNNKLFNSRTY